jgi:hypothetical protein
LVCQPSWVVQGCHPQRGRAIEILATQHSTLSLLSTYRDTKTC